VANMRFMRARVSSDRHLNTSIGDMRWLPSGALFGFIWPMPIPIKDA